MTEEPAMQEDHPDLEAPLTIESGYAGPERRVRRPPMTLPRPLVLAVCAVIFVSVMAPLGFILVYSHRADGRAERAQDAACTLLNIAVRQEAVAERAVDAVERQQLVLGRGLELAVGRDDREAVDDLLEAVADVESALADTEEAQDEAGRVLEVARRFDLPCAPG